MKSPRRHPQARFNESVIGTAFYWFGQGKHSPVDIRAEECDRIDNQLDVFSKTFLGLTVACARCHDHKFDAITTNDYYALAGYLQSSRLQYAIINSEEEIAIPAAQLAKLKTDSQQLLRDVSAERIRSGLTGMSELLVQVAEVESSNSSLVAGDSA